MHTLNEFDPVPKPDEFPDDLWEKCTPGERVRILRRNEDSVFLGVKVYKAMGRLPFWAFYGPEHGLPPDWFNPRGFLLPRFRPGGPDFPIFSAWRYRFETSMFLHQRLMMRFHRTQERLFPLITGGSLLLYMMISLVLQQWLDYRFGDFWGSGLSIPLMIVGVPVLLLVLALLRDFVGLRLRVVFVRCALRKLAVRKPNLGTVEQISGPQG